MSRIQSGVLVLLALGLVVPPAAAQPQLRSARPAPQLLIVSPPGGQAGKTIEVTLSGLDLDEPQKLLFSAAGIMAEPITATAAPKDTKKPPPKETKKQPVKKPAGPSTVKFKVTIPADTPPGLHDVRLVNARGVSNPRVFAVGDLREVMEKEPNSDVTEAQRIDLNSTINGVISAPTDVDYFVFTGKKDQRVVVSCLSSSIDSKLPAALEFYNKAGKLLASNREYHDSDALLDCTLAADGDYYVRVFSFTYTQGGPDHFYRLTISTAPWIDAIYPPIIEPGKKNQVTVYGRNLPGGKADPSAVIDGKVLEKLSVTVEAPADAAALHQLRYSGHVPPRSSALDGFQFRLKNYTGVSNSYLLTYAHAPVVVDNEDNDTAEKAQEVTLPCDIAGRVEKRRDRDWYRFHVKKGETYTIELFADRIGSPAAMRCKLVPADSPDAKKGQAIEFADNPESLHPLQFLSRSDDPVRQRFTAKTDGTYLLQVWGRDADLLSGPRHLYHVRITPERPDFRLVIMPAATTTPDAGLLQQGGRVYYTVLAWRLDGFTGPIALSAEGLPEGVTCPPQVVGTGQKQATLVLSADAEVPDWTGAIVVKGTATINGKAEVRQARPATITWPVPQINIPTLSRLDRQLVLAVRDKAPYRLTAGIDTISVAPGGKVTVPIKLERLQPEFKGNVQVTALNLPQNQIVFGNNNQPFNLTKEQTDLVLTVRPGTPPGDYTIVFRGQAPAGNAPQKGKQLQGAAYIQPATPVTITVTGRETASVSVTPNAVKLRPGDRTKLIVKVIRPANYSGPLRVQLVVPDGLEGIEPAAVTIPAGQDETRLVIKIADDATPGRRAGLLVRIEGGPKGKTLFKQDVKLPLNVVN
jgi:hypothetical protein